jgi:hypothetical protein
MQGGMGLYYNLRKIIHKTKMSEELLVVVRHDYSVETSVASCCSLLWSCVVVQQGENISEAEG